MNGLSCAQGIHVKQKEAREGQGCRGEAAPSRRWVPLWDPNVGSQQGCNWPRDVVSLGQSLDLQCKDWSCYDQKTIRSRCFLELHSCLILYNKPFSSPLLQEVDRIIKMKKRPHISWLELIEGSVRGSSG